MDRIGLPSDGTRAGLKLMGGVHLERRNFKSVTVGLAVGEQDPAIGKPLESPSDS